MNFSEATTGGVLWKKFNEKIDSREIKSLFTFYII